MNPKKEAALKAIELVTDGMCLGLGTGSTVYYFVEAVGKLVANGMKLTCVSTSNRTTEQAKELGISIVDIDDIEYLDLVVDGADEIDSDRNGIKGGGGALLREKMVALLAKKYCWIVNKEKLVEKLGAFPLPIEIVSFGKAQTIKRINELGYLGSIRMKDNKPFITDNGNLIYDLDTKKNFDAYKLNKELKSIVGVVETGLFVDMVDIIYVGG